MFLEIAFVINILKNSFELFQNILYIIYVRMKKGSNMKYEVVKVAFPEFMDYLERMNKKIKKFGKAITIENTEEATKYDDRKNPYQVVLVTLSNPEIVSNGKNVTSVGMISIKDGIKTVYNTNEKFVLNTMELRCDHCNKNRKRNKYYVFEENGKALMIGSGCSEEYFGINVEGYIQSYFDYFGTPDDEDSKGEDFSNISNYGDNINVVIQAVYLATNKWTKYLSRDKAEIMGTTSTATSVAGILGNKFEYIYNRDYSLRPELEGLDCEEVKKTLISKYSNMVPTGDFEYNIKSMLFYEDDTLRDVFKSVGIVAFAIFKAMQREPEEGPKQESKYLGAVGDKVQCKVTLKDVRSFDTMYGTSYLMTFDDEAGNVIKTFTTGAIVDVEVGTVLTIKGTIKVLEEYKGVKNTQLTRVKIVN